MRLRKLRIAWSVGWGVLAVILCVLWVRSYWWQEQFVRISSSNNRYLTLGHCYGAVYLRTGDPLPRDLKAYPNRDEWYAYRDKANPYRAEKFLLKLKAQSGLRGIHLPHWLLMLLCCAVSGSPWLRRRFSLRTLLIATTLIALALGTIVWLAHR